MTLVELKQQITDKQCDGTFMIFVCPKLPIIAEQYIDAIAEVRQLDKLFVNSIFDTQTSAFSLVMDFDTNLKVCRTETFSEIAEDYMQFNDTIVLCEAVDKKLQKLVADYVVTFPTKLETWQAAAYMQSICPGLNTPACEWLYEACKGDLYKVINELDKIKVFPQNEQALMLELLKLEPNIGDGVTAVKIFSNNHALRVSSMLSIRRTSPKKAATANKAANNLNFFILFFFAFAILHLHRIVWNIHQRERKGSSHGAFVDVIIQFSIFYVHCLHGLFHRWVSRHPELFVCQFHHIEDPDLSREHLPAHSDL